MGRLGAPLLGGGQRPGGLRLEEDLARHTDTVEGLAWARLGRLGMGFGATVNAAFCTLGIGLTIGWLAYGPSGGACPSIGGAGVPPGCHSTRATSSRSHELIYLFTYLLNFLDPLATVTSLSCSSLLRQSRQ